MSSFIALRRYGQAQRLGELGFAAALRRDAKPDRPVPATSGEPRAPRGLDWFAAQFAKQLAKLAPVRRDD